MLKFTLEQSYDKKFTLEQSFDKLKWVCLGDNISYTGTIRLFTVIFARMAIFPPGFQGGNWVTL